LLGSLLSAQCATAATITQSIDFTASDFTSVPGAPPPPVSPVTGRFTLNFDPNLDYNNDTTDISASGLNINLGGFGGDLAFNYNSLFRILEIHTGNFVSVGGGTNGLFLVLNYETNPYFDALFVYAQEGHSFTYTAGTVSVAYSPSLTTTPIPSSVLMLLTGLAAMGGMSVFRRRDGALAA
jgi:hypothetical protein